MFSWPGIIEPGIRSDLVSSLDTFPTILSAVGIEVPDGLPGIDLWSSIQTGQSIQRTTIFGDTYAHDIADLNNPEASLLYLWCIQDRWKLILSYDGLVHRYAAVHPRIEPIRLFDIISDPHEAKNLAGQYPRVVLRLKEEIENWYPLRERKLVSGR